ncbi:MAG: DUF4842 domain-containing protein [Alistipes sp.]
MKIRHTFQLSLLTLACVGCVENSEDVAKINEAKVSAVETLADYTVPVKQGMATIVKLGEETLATTSEPMTITVPRYALATNALTVTYSADEIYKNFASAQYWQYVSFEDQRRGDYDYNDLVIHCRVVSLMYKENGIVKYRHTVSAQPVASGGAISLKLGILYKPDPTFPSLAEKILCENVRQDLFVGDVSFPINTDPTKARKQVSRVLKPLFEISTFDSQFPVVWFIDTPLDRLYAATTNFGANTTLDMISPDGLPYGISLTKKWNYPVEKCKISIAYPGFDNWMKSGREDNLLQAPNRAWLFPAMANQAGMVDLWDYDK